MAKPAATFNPRIILDKRLWTLRQIMQTTGESLRDWDGVIREVRERRGEQDEK